MKRPLPLWLAAVIPATLAGHGLAYALTGRSAADAHHAWMAPVLECSIALLVAFVLLALGSALLKAHILIHTQVERSWTALWPRLALSQILLFTAIERAEGAHVAAIGVLMQIVIALLIAYTVSLFAGLLVRCARSAYAASRYLQRMLHSAARYANRRPALVAQALAVRVGTSRFQRPPPYA